MESIKALDLKSTGVLEQNLMNMLVAIQPEKANQPQEKVPLAKGCDGSCSGCSSCSGAEHLGW